MDSPHFNRPTAHNVARIEAVYVGPIAAPGYPDFVSVELKLLGETGEGVSVGVFGPSVAAEKYRRLAQAVNEIFSQGAQS